MPQRTWIGSGWGERPSGVSSSPASSALIAMCSAAWYWNTRFRSGISDSSARYPTRMPTRIAPSTSANTTPFRPIRSVRSAGEALNNTSENPIANTNATTIEAVDSSSVTSSESSSDAAHCADRPSARKPIASESPSATMPRMNGSRSSRWRVATEVAACETWEMRPSGRRTDTAQ